MSHDLKRFSKNPSMSLTYCREAGSEKYGEIEHEGKKLLLYEKWL